MAHLIKLEDYVSRYQFDLYRYPSQYSRMKKERWYYIKMEWEQARLKQNEYEIEVHDDLISDQEEVNLFTRLFRRFSRTKKGNIQERELKDPDVHSPVRQLTLEQLKSSFLDELFISQLRWASSSLLEESTLHPRYKRDTWLRFFTQQLPDNYFLMYKPVFHIKNAPIDLDMVLISPTEIICLTIIEGHENSVFDASSDRFWIEYIDQTRKKRLSPLVALTRMSGVIEWIFEQEGYSFPIRKVVLSPSSLIDDRLQGTSIQFVDRRTFDSWHDQMKRHPSPLKSEQMKAASILFHYCEASSHQLHSVEREENDPEMVE